VQKELLYHRPLSMQSALAGAKGVIVPQALVNAIGDVMIVSRGAAPSYSEESS